MYFCVFVESLIQVQSDTKNYRSILTDKFGEFSINSDKWKPKDLFAWLELYKNGQFNKYKKNLEKFFQLEKLPTEKEKLSSTISEAVLSLFECRKHFRIAVIQNCGVKDVKDCEELLDLLENAFQVRKSKKVDNFVKLRFSVRNILG